MHFSLQRHATNKNVPINGQNLYCLQVIKHPYSKILTDMAAPIGCPHRFTLFPAPLTWTRSDIPPPSHLSYFDSPANPFFLSRLSSTVPKLNRLDPSRPLCENPDQFISLRFEMLASRQLDADESWRNFGTMSGLFRSSRCWSLMLIFR